MSRKIVYEGSLSLSVRPAGAATRFSSLTRENIERKNLRGINAAETNHAEEQRTEMGRLKMRDQENAGPGK